MDFGTPEAEQGGMDRTLSEHVLAVADAIAHVCRETGQKVHMVGYSQGGMFVYQTAAYLKGDGIASLVTLGSPVDMRRNLPVPLHDSLSARFIKLARRAIDGPLGDLEGLPGTLTSRGVKLLSPRQEVKHLLGVLGLLHDREALERRESKRRFLAGEGFIAWPGPAFRSFVDEFIVDNRMKRGGFVILAHPWRSLVWELQSIKHLMQKWGLRLVRIDLCMWGATGRRSMGFFTCWWDSLETTP